MLDLKNNPGHSYAPILIMTLPVIIVLIGFGFYYARFGKLGISDSQEIWAHFATYLNVWVSLASLIAIASLTYYIHRREVLDNVTSRQREDALNRPYLVMDFTQEPNNYEVKNIGTGPALNILIGFRPKYDSNYVEPVPVDSIGIADRTTVTEITELSTFELVLVYNDIWGQKHTTLWKFGTTRENIIMTNHNEFNFDGSYKYSVRSRGFS